MDQSAWRRVCIKAFDNLPTDTAVTMSDVDAILTWCAQDAAILLGAAGMLAPREGISDGTESA